MDTIVVHTPNDDSADEIRSKQVAYLKMGLKRYIINTPIADHIEIRINKVVEQEITTDRWNNWVFTVGLN